MIVTTFFSQAGGVGKTTLAMATGHLLADAGRRVVLIDADPQGSLTAFSGYRPEETQATLTNVLLDSTDPQEVLLPGLADPTQETGVRLIPANVHLAVAEQGLASMDLRDFRFKEAIAPLSEVCDYCLIDCPPSLGMLSYTALVAAQGVIVPCQTQHKALESINVFAQTWARIKRGANRDLALLGVVPTLYNRGYKHDRERLAELKASGLPCLSPIPRATIVAEASRRCLPINRMPGVSQDLLSPFQEVANVVAQIPFN